MRNYRVRHPFSLADEGATPGGLLQLSRLALVVGALTILVGVGVGYYSYRVSRDALLETLYDVRVSVQGDLNIGVAQAILLNSARMLFARMLSK